MGKKMKKLFALLIITIVLSSIPLVAAVNAKSVTCKVVYIYEESFAKPDGVGKPPKPPKPDPEPEEPQLYELMGPKWKTLPVNYVINPSNDDGLSFEVVTSVISSSAETWDAALTTINIFNNAYTTDESISVDLDDPKTNTFNEIVFGDIPQSGAIAVCLVWSTTRGPPSQRGIVEFDIVFDNVDFTWGTDGSDSVMDLQNIATHELGHALGLADLYFDEASEQTMYGIGQVGETKKRTLDDGDIAGITVLYG